MLARDTNVRRHSAHRAHHSRWRRVLASSSCSCCSPGCRTGSSAEAFEASGCCCCCCCCGAAMRVRRRQRSGAAATVPALPSSHSLARSCIRLVHFNGSQVAASAAAAVVLGGRLAAQRKPMLPALLSGLADVRADTRARLQYERWHMYEPPRMARGNGSPTSAVSCCCCTK